MIGINETTNPIATILPIVMLMVGGYLMGRIFYRACGTRKDEITVFLVGNLLINFLFVSGFIIFGVVTYHVKEYFTIYTYVLAVMSIAGALVYFSIVRARLLRLLRELKISHPSTIFSLILFLILATYSAFLVYYHPIFSEYDFLYTYLPISKSILEGNGLDHDYYTGSDIAMRAPPFSQAVNAWLIHSFGYSSLKMFPFYYVVLASLFVYVLTKLVVRSKDSFVPLVSGSAFLINPAMLVVTSRFSLQQDLPYIFILAACFAFFLQLVLSRNIPKDVLIVLPVSLCLLILTREIGLVISVAILFLIPSMRFVQKKTWLKVLLAMLSVSPLYLLTTYDLARNGFTPTLSIRLASLLILNGAMIYIVLQFRDQYNSVNLFTSSKYLIVLIIPGIFLVSNIFLFHGLYPTLSLSSEFNKSVVFYRDIFGISNPLQRDIYQSLFNVPRLDILFISVAVGSVFLFYRIVGFGMMLYRIRKNKGYAAVIILFLCLLITWSYLLNSGFEVAAIRHIAYFIPLLCVIFAVGMLRHDNPFYRIFYYGIMILAVFYFLNFDIFTYIYNNHFGGFWIDPFYQSILNTKQFRLSAAVIAGLAIFAFIQEKMSVRKAKLLSGSQTVLVLAFLTSVLVYILVNSGVSVTPLEILDSSPPTGWERGVSGVLNYLNRADSGNVFGLRAPAIPSFTNRTDYDIFSPHAIPSVLPLLLTDNSSYLKTKLEDMNIRYIVLPNERNQLYYLTRNLGKESNLTRIINQDSEFRTMSVGEYNVTKLVRKTEGIDLLNDTKLWKGFGNARVKDSPDSLVITASTAATSRIYNRAYMNTTLEIDTQRDLILSVDYATNSSSSTGSFAIEFRDDNKLLWSIALPPTSGTLLKKSFLILGNTLTENAQVRLYIITDGEGSHSLSIRKAQISYS